MTYSIVAVDLDTDEIGVAVQTCWPGVGASVPWLEPGAGAIATQSFTNVSIGPQGLARLRDGLPAETVLRDVLAEDHGRDVRQVGIVDLAGRSAAHTGDRCVAEAGHATAPGVSVQANTLERSGVWVAMLDAYHAASGDLADRLMAALLVGDASGGDIRGSRSAALVVAPGSRAAPAWARRYDVRIDGSAAPIAELAEHLRVARAYEALDAAIIASEAGELEAAVAATSKAYGLTPGDPQIGFWHAMLLSATGRSEPGARVLAEALRGEPRLAEFGRRYAEAGHGAAMADWLRSAGRATTGVVRSGPTGR